MGSPNTVLPADFTLSQSSLLLSDDVTKFTPFLFRFNKLLEKWEQKKNQSTPKYNMAVQREISDMQVHHSTH